MRRVGHEEYHSNLDHQERFCSRPMPHVAPPAPPNTPTSCRTDQGPNRDAPAAAGPEQTGLADRAPAARSAAAAGSPQAARWQVQAAVSDPNCSRPAPGRPSGSDVHHCRVVVANGAGWGSGCAPPRRVEQGKWRPSSLDVWASDRTERNQSIEVLTAQRPLVAMPGLLHPTLALARCRLRRASSAEQRPPKHRPGPVLRHRRSCGGRGCPNKRPHLSKRAHSRCILAATCGNS